MNKRSDEARVEEDKSEMSEVMLLEETKSKKPSITWCDRKNEELEWITRIKKLWEVIN